MVLGPRGWYYWLGGITWRASSLSDVSKEEDIFLWMKKFVQKPSPLVKKSYGRGPQCGCAGSSFSSMT